MTRTRATRPATFVPREIQTAIQRSLARPDEAIQHIVALLDRDTLTFERNPDQPWYWLVVTDRQLLFVPHAEGVDGAPPRLSMPVDAILGIEVGSVLLKTWITIYADAAQIARPEADCEPWYVVAKGPAEEASADPVLTAQRIEFHYSTLPAVQVAVRDLIKPRPFLLPAGRRDEPATETPSLLPRLEPALRPMVRALLAAGEWLQAVIFAPPGGTTRDRKQGPAQDATQMTPRSWSGVAVTDRRVLLLELPPPPMPDGLRYEAIVTQVTPEAIHDVSLIPVREDSVELRIRVRHDAAEMTWRIELDEARAGQWQEGVARLEELVRAAKLPMHPEYGRFVAITDLRDIVLTNPAHYAILLKQIREHRYYLGEHGRAVDLREAAQDWYQSLYSRITAQLTARGVQRGTPADMYMRLCEYKWLASEQLGIDIGFDLALQAFQYWVA
jgi:hypothetical protein